MPESQKDGYRAISIHAPREGCDVEAYLVEKLSQLFQSTHPARGATPIPDPPKEG